MLMITFAHQGTELVTSGLAAEENLINYMCHLGQNSLCLKTKLSLNQCNYTKLH